ncbi:MAG TPA: hypothetical protein VF981_14165 [Gemmatimonadaceae bacterium]
MSEPQEYVPTWGVIERAYVSMSTSGMPVLSRSADEERMLARIRFHKALKAHDAEQQRIGAERGWDEGNTHGYQDAQAHHGQGVMGEGCGPDSWDCTCPNPHRKQASK